MAGRITHPYLIGRDKRAMRSVKNPTQKLPEHLKTIIDRDGYEMAIPILCANNWASINPWENGKGDDVIVGYGRIAPDNQHYNMSHRATKDTFSAAFKFTPQGVQSYIRSGYTRGECWYYSFVKKSQRFYRYDTSAQRPFPNNIGKVGSEKVAPIDPKTVMPSPESLFADIVAATPQITEQFTDEHRAAYMRVASFALACAQR